MLSKRNLFSFRWRGRSFIGKLFRTGVLVDQAGFFERNEFVIRRVHSLLGLVPVGLFMAAHLFVNASVFNGVESFQNQVYMIHSLGPLVLVVEWVFIFLPILAHALMGFWFIHAAKSNTRSYPYGKNYRYVAQRVTGMIAFFFILWHVLHMNGVIHAEWFRESIADAIGLAQFRPYNAASTAAEAMQNPIVTVLYTIGMLSCVFHFANGLWTMGITWGVWVSPAAQKRASQLCLGFGAVLAVVGMVSIVGLWRTDVEAAEQRENEMYQQRVADGTVMEDSYKTTSGTEGH